MQLVLLRFTVTCSSYGSNFQCLTQRAQPEGQTETVRTVNFLHIQDFHN